MTWARVGVKCVCVKEARRIYEYDQGCTFAEIGQTYTVRDVGVFGGRVGIVLEEIINPIGDVTKGFGGETGFPIHFFRPPHHPSRRYRAHQKSLAACETRVGARTRIGHHP